MQSVKTFVLASEEKLPMWLIQAVKFGLVGVLNTGVDLGLYALLTHWTGWLAAVPVTAKAISYSAGIVNSFIFNRGWTFRSQSSAIKTLIPFVLGNLAGLAVNTGLMQVGIHTLNLNEWMAVGFATCSTLLWNYAFSKFVVFRK